MKIALCQINPTLGAFSKNREKIIQFLERAKEKGCSLALFPECALFGYHPFDMLERSSLVEQQEKELVQILKDMPAGIAAVVGVLKKRVSRKGRPYFNSAVLLEKKKKPQFFYKELLPTGDVFDEARFIENGSMEDNFFKINGKQIFLTICEDIWAWEERGSSRYKENPITKIKGKKVDLVVNLSASPFYPNKNKDRYQLVKKTAQYFKAPMIYLNMVGAQDEIIFDGDSFALDAKGKELIRCHSFEQDFQILDLDKKVKPKKKNLLPSEALRKALVLGVRDFCEKSGLKHVHLGLSGGVDSALVACLAVEALGEKNVTGISIPGPFTSELSLKLAQKLAQNLKIEFFETPITESYEQIQKNLEKSFKINKFSVVNENLQARLRGLTLMAFSNHRNSLLLVTSNKSELACGYATLYGDLCGGLAPIGDLLKKQIYELCDLYNEKSELIPQEILTRAPTAELRANQKDEDSLPPYSKLDQSVKNIVENCDETKSPTDEWVLQALMKSEFKRWQAPPILKVSKHSFGRGRRWPIAHQAAKTKQN